jgi:hypothetical protein
MDSPMLFDGPAVGAGNFLPRGHAPGATPPRAAPASEPSESPPMAGPANRSLPTSTRVPALRCDVENRLKAGWERDTPERPGSRASPRSPGEAGGTLAELAYRPGGERPCRSGSPSRCGTRSPSRSRGSVPAPARDQRVFDTRGGVNLRSNPVLSTAICRPTFP